MSAAADGDAPAGSGGPGAPPLALTAAYAVKVPAFEGPLDLLLHLIRINEVEITDIPVARIAEQYVEYLGLMRELNLDVAGEHLVMAATLAWIKSRMLLPPERSEEDGEEIDPRAELVARLLEYQRFKEVSQQLGDRHLLGRDVFAARGAAPEPVADGAREIEAGLFELLDAYRRVLARPQHSGRAHEVEVESITVRDRMISVMQQLEVRDAQELEGLLGDVRGAVRLPFLVATFLAILELTRLGLLRIYQGVDEVGTPQGPIHCRRAVEAGEVDWEERISHLM